MIICFSFVREGIFRYLELYTHASIGRNIAPCYLNVGWRSNGNGGYNDENYGLYTKTLEENNFDFEKTNQFVLQDLVKDMKKNASHLPMLFLSKVKINHNEDNVKLMFLSDSIREKEMIATIDYIEKYLMLVTNLYYMMIMIGMGIGAIFNIKDKKLSILYLCICIFGVVLELLLVESQQLIVML